MTIPVFIDPGLLTGVCGLLAGVICLLALRRHRIATAGAHAEVRSMVREQEAEWSERMEQLEMRAQNTDDAAKVTHSARAGALQLLRSGMSAESAVSTLGIGRREMRLIAEVSRTRALK